MISIKQNDKPPLVKTEMICDGGLASKLDKFEMLHHLNQHSTTLLIGRPKSGKTSLITSLFSSPSCMKRVFHKVFLFQPSASSASVKDNVFDKLPDEQKYDELTYDSLLEVYSKIEALPKNHNKCIILDDQASYLKNKELQKLFKNLCYNRRHMGVSVYFLSQTYFSVPREIRKSFNNLFIFKTSKMELTTIFEEQIELDKEYVLPISKLVFDKPYQYIMINTDLQKLYKGFDEIIINDENEI